MLGRHEIRVFTDPAETGLLRPGLFHDRSSINIRPSEDPRRPVVYFGFQERQSVAENAMVILAPGITGDAAIALAFASAMAGVVVHSHDNDRSASRQDDPGIGPPTWIASHPGHGAVKFPAQPFL